MRRHHPMCTYSIVVVGIRLEALTEAQMAEETARREREARLLNIKTSSSARSE
jgi:hypothetical protein